MKILLFSFKIMNKLLSVLFGSGILMGFGLFFLAPVIASAGGAFYIDSVTGFAGFGDTNPQSQVDVSGAIYSRLVTATTTAINWNSGNVQENDTFKQPDTHLL
jgi:hypothetical protein